MSGGFPGQMGGARLLGPCHGPLGRTLVRCCLNGPQGEILGQGHSQGGGHAGRDGRCAPQEEAQGR
nr:MAG: hypothetical protein DIU70_14440 [Bacillota bacterium]